PLLGRLSGLPAPWLSDLGARPFAFWRAPATPATAPELPDTDGVGKGNIGSVTALGSIAGALTAQGDIGSVRAGGLITTSVTAETGGAPEARSNHHAGTAAIQPGAGPGTAGHQPPGPGPGQRSPGASGRADQAGGPAQ